MVRSVDTALEQDLILREAMINIPNELRRHIGCGAKVVAVRRVEGEVWVGVTADTPAVVRHSTDLPECPARDGRRARDVTRVRLEEVDLIHRVAVANTTQKCEEDQQDGTGHEEQAQKAQSHPYGAQISIHT